MRIAAADRTEYTEGRRDRVASAGDRQFDDVLRIEVDRVGCERGAAGVFHTLIHRQDRQVTGTTEPAVPEQRLHAAQHPGLAVAQGHHPVDEIPARQLQHVLRDRGATVFQQIPGLVTEQLYDVGHWSSPPTATQGQR